MQHNETIKKNPTFFKPRGRGVIECFHSPTTMNYCTTPAIDVSTLSSAFPGRDSPVPTTQNPPMRMGKNLFKSQAGLPSRELPLVARYTFAAMSNHFGGHVCYCMAAYFV